jgi:hypothetical protein
MNRVLILTNAPDDAHWATMSQGDKQSAVVDLAIAALTEDAANDQELDVWEAQHLRSALSAIYTDFFSLSLQGIALALAPPEERAPGWAQRFPKEIPTVHQFHRAFDQIRYRPIDEV